MEENKITFEDIKRVNESIQTTDIKGKEYAEVNQRVKAFRMLYPKGIIETTMLKNEEGVCIFRAAIYDGQHLLATGTAYEKENSTFINKTSYIENCETSAVGRALGMAGFGIDTSIASAEEVQNAIANQDKPVKKTTKTIKALPEQVETIANGCGSEENIKKLCEQKEVNSLADLTIEQASEIIKKLNERKEKENE